MAKISWAAMIEKPSVNALSFCASDQKIVEFVNNRKELLDSISVQSTHKLLVVLQLCH